ncbi:MAG: hypothetical protein AAF772_16940, partial [Acidobacteriota bacterium]
MAVLLSAAEQGRAQTSSCVQGAENFRDGIFVTLPFYANVDLFSSMAGEPSDIAVFVTERYKSEGKMPSRNVLQAAINRWSAECPGADDLPAIRVSWHADAPTRDEMEFMRQNDYNRFRRTIVLDLDPRPADAKGNVAHAALWDSNVNTITFFERCPSGGTYGFPCVANQPGQLIRWTAPEAEDWFKNIVTHEFGHGLGFDHDRGDRCHKKSVMAATFDFRDQGLLPITPQHCRLLDKMLDLEASCNNALPEPHENHSCEDESFRPEQGAPGGPGGMGSGNAREYCAAYPGLCINPNPWNGGGIDCSWGCVEIADNFGDRRNT